MNLEQLANVGEFISGIAVIASLIYLGIQIRQNTRSVKSSTLAANTANWSSMLVFPGFQMVWKITREGFFPAFGELVERLINEIDEGDSFQMVQKWRQLARQRKTEQKSEFSNQ